MEINAPLAAEAEEEARLHCRVDGSTVLYSIRDTPTTYQGDNSNEETPMLPREESHSIIIDEDDASDDQDESVHRPWLGGKEFASKPPWRRPSVRGLVISVPLILDSPAFHLSNYKITRYGGCFHRYSPLPSPLVAW